MSQDALQASAPLLEAQGLCKRFKRRRSLLEWFKAPTRPVYTEAVRALDLHLQPGEIVGLIGPNGAGKTTLLKLLAGLILPDEGSGRLAGQPLGSANARAALGLVTADERSFYWRLTGRENLRFFGALHGLQGAALQRRLEVLELQLGLGDALSAPVRTLSSGNRGRLALARGLLHAPKVLLLDEVARSLDPGAAAKLRRLLKATVHGSQVTALYATHDLHEVERLCDRVLLLEQGRVSASGRFAEIAAAARLCFELEDDDWEAGDLGTGQGGAGTAPPGAAADQASEGDSV